MLQDSLPFTDSGPGHMSVRDWLRRRGHAKPFLRWAGGKSPFLQRYSHHFPVVTGRYLEPFLGSGSVFFHLQRAQLQPLPALLGDANRQLAISFIQIRDNVDQVISELVLLVESYLAASSQSDFYRLIRADYNARLPGVSAATFIFLNRTCWNGLYRLNRKGEFNVPHGRPSSNDAFLFPTPEDLRNCSAALQSAEILATSWDNLVGEAKKGDFVFLDPPYYSDIVDRSQKYLVTNFSQDEHFRLARHLTRLVARGIDFLLTNSAEPNIVSMYLDLGLDVQVVAVPRYISSKTEQRVATNELIVRPPGKGFRSSAGFQLEADVR